ncbi:MAG: winged helix-turn-helix domain-containing protein [Methanosarcina sp.]|uniref:ArsR/SmtB family transcription factor n=1 Tax=Methanosarcina sp. TaxID=2213 RepID=UPI002612E4A3|nr:winged helix-turn-helix domain-containing protein [Methanosarcina sp.]MDD3246454.1 winged helix-turn-helix domain-containing protein [Methanosarcina sp.]MDD4248661.1 winged helix-turn-helix domain-containing protein [Methanosarcina sp.]
MEITEDLVPVPVLSLPAEVSLLARTLSRILPMQILKQLQKKQMSAGELASELGLCLNTLTYNLAVLEKVGLIKVGQVKWSCKGREVKIYAPAEQPVLLVPRANRDSDPFVLDSLEKNLENCRANLSGQADNLFEGSGRNDERASSDKKYNDQEALPAHTRYAVLFPVKETHDRD